MQVAELQKLIQDVGSNTDIKIVSDESMYLSYNIKKIKYDKDSKKITISIKPAHQVERNSERGVEL